MEDKFNKFIIYFIVFILIFIDRNIQTLNISYFFNFALDIIFYVNINTIISPMHTLSLVLRIFLRFMGIFDEFVIDYHIILFFNFDKMFIPRNEVLDKIT